MLSKLSSKNRNKKVLPCCFLFLLFFVLETAAQDTKIIEKKNDNKFPSVMSYEGYITNSDGTPFEDGNYDFTFAIYTEAAGGSPIWIEEHKSVTVNSGFIQLYLGRGTVPNPLNLPFDKQYYVGISVGEAPEMTPRLELTSTGYSFRSKMADEVSDASITTEKLAPHSVTDDKIKSVSWDKITDVPTGKVAELHNGEEDPSDPLNDQTHYIHTKGSIEMVFDRDDNSDDRTFSIRRDGLSRNDEGIELLRVVERDSALIYVIVKVADETQSTSPSDGALVVDGGVGIAKDLNIGGTLKAAAGEFKYLKVKGPGREVNGMGNYVAFFENDSSMGGDGDGIAIKVNTSTPNNDNNFVTFLDNENNTRGRIEGQTGTEVLLSPMYIFDTALNSISVAMAITDLVGAIGSTHPCIGPAPCVAPSIASLIIKATLNLVVVGGGAIAQQVYYFNNLGVSYASGNGDYAEYLKREKVEEQIDPGDIVGVFGGRVTKSTKDAQQYMVVSLAPIVLGNMPLESEEHLYEKVAFMGQVPIKVIGPVKEGDYIIPSGLEDGTGIAVSPEMMTADEFSMVLGRAWGSSDDKFLKLINVVVGLNQGDISTFVRRQMSELQQTRSEVDELRTEVARLKDAIHNVIQLQPYTQNVDLHTKNE